MPDSRLPSDDRRRGDRRRAPTRLWQVLLRPGGRRRHDRRGLDRRTYVDRPRRGVVGIVLFIVVCSVADAALTLLWLDDGGEEANPIMALALAGGTDVFLVVKLLLTGVGVWLLAAHQNFRIGDVGLRLIAAGYIVLLGYHAALVLGS